MFETWSQTISTHINIFVCLQINIYHHQVRLLFWERKYPDHTLGDSGAAWIDHQRVAERVKDRHFGFFLFQHIAVHSVPKAERRSDGREICFYQGLTTLLDSTCEDLKCRHSSRVNNWKLLVDRCHFSKK